MVLKKIYTCCCFLSLGSPGLHAHGNGSDPGINPDNQPPSRPNIILIMADDLGFSDVGCYGSEISTPNIDRLAHQGVRFSQFHSNTACCPTRASLLTGLYPHAAGVGYMDSDWGHEGYQGRIKHDVPTLAEILSEAGYATYMAGKWHLGTRKGDNPWERGFDNFYGIPKGGGVYFWPPLLDRDVVLYEKSNGEGPVITNPDPDTFYSTDAFTSYLVGKITDLANTDQPFFMYAAYIAPHWPQQAKIEDIRKFRGKYTAGWSVLRKDRYDRQVDLGIIGSNVRISPDDGAAWNTLTAEESDQLDLQMAVYAAQVHNLDQNIGRILEALDVTNLSARTMVVFLSDNGAQENDDTGFERNPGALFGSRFSLGGYAKGWGNLSNTPYRGYKLKQYNGGITTPLVVRWPGSITCTDIIIRQVAHVIDIFPTCLAAAGLDIKNVKAAWKQNPEGINLMPFLKGTRPCTDRELFWEHMGNRAVRKGDWKMVASFGQEWHLYNLADDPAELNDLSPGLEPKVKELRTAYDLWAERSGVLPWPVARE